MTAINSNPPITIYNHGMGLLLLTGCLVDIGRTVALCVLLAGPMTVTSVMYCMVLFTRGMKCTSA